MKKTGGDSVLSSINPEKSGQQLFREEAVEEIVANSTENFLNDEDFIKEITTEHKSIASRIVEWLNDIVDSIKELISTRAFHAGTKALMEDLDQYEHARDLWVKAVDEASDRMKTSEVSSNSTNRLQIKHIELMTEENLEKNLDETSLSSPILTITENDLKSFQPLMNEMERTNQNTKLRDEMALHILNILRSKGDAYNPVLGNVGYNINDIKADMSHDKYHRPYHFDGKEMKYAAYPYIPEIIRNAKPVYWDKNHGDGYDTVLLAGKVRMETDDINDGIYNVVVSVAINPGNNKFHVHEVIAQKINSEGAANVLRKSLIHDSGVKGADRPLKLYNIAEYMDSYNAYNSHFSKEKIVKTDSGHFQLNINDTQMDSDGTVSHKAKKKLRGKGLAEQTGTLIAVHNIDATKLGSLLGYDSIPMPSIAITKADMGWNDFGDISFIFRKNTIDPAADKRNRVYGADAWKR